MKRIVKNMIFERLYLKDILTLRDFGIYSLSDLFHEKKLIEQKKSKISRYLRGIVIDFSENIVRSFKEESIKENMEMYISTAIKQLVIKE